jgi:hypothetical protein
VVLAFEAFAVLPKLSLDRERSVERPLCMVLMRYGRAEQRTAPEGSCALNAKLRALRIFR